MRSFPTRVATILIKAKFHYAIWSQTCSELEFGPSFSSLATS